MSDNFFNEKLENSEDNHVPFMSILEEDVEGIKQHFVALLILTMSAISRSGMVPALH